ncbi:MAG: tyrosine--tRNA ligase [Candidatus Omnitrophica bacterium]|nr:tyrosine--tRNA ligase [Candidatus Omnitrophota bacterium]MDD5236888.1 tyrosine--tRNA ligase [Candidatus Omnitrophota bacterium]MDD5610155.1 tyrosine--tRNA ligase [Candidatus Omnitrophota bacterium]
MKNIEEQLRLIKRGVVEIISEEELVRKLERSVRENKPLTIKAGFDPTAPDLHLGHTVLLGKLRQFQELGHKVVFLIGDFTGMIGDPTGRSEVRKQLTKHEVEKNAETYKHQISKVLDMKRLEIVFNSRWFDKMTVTEILKLTTHATVSQMLARSDFKKRLEQNQDISLLEFMYPILQGYDSVQLNADIELGGTDQIFNLLVGRDLQRDFHQEPQVVMTMPLLEGTDGVQKMSKSYGNYIGINEPPDAMFGKVMSISDVLMMKYFELLTEEDLSPIKAMHPKEAKMKLAKIITAHYHGENQAEKAEKEFQRVFSAKELPSDMPVLKLTAAKPVLEIMLEAGLVASGNEARRMIKQGAVMLDNGKIDSEKFVIEKSGILKVGSRRFLKIEF